MLRVLLFGVMISLSACFSHGVMNAATGTSVVLQSNNYKTLKTGARGVSYGFSLLGLIPIVSPTAASAKSNLYGDVQIEMGGRSTALANQTEDRSVLYLGLFSIPRYIITADVIEFTENQQTNYGVSTQVAAVEKTSLENPAPKALAKQK